MLNKTIKIFLKLLLIYIIFIAIILLGNRYHFTIPVEYDILDLNDILGGILGGFALVFFALPLSFLDLLNISWQTQGCSWFCPPSIPAIIFILIFDIIVLYIFAFIIPFLKRLRERLPPINRKAKLITILVIVLFGSVTYWFVNKNNFYSESGDCYTGNYLGVLTPARHLSSGNCEILPSSCIPQGYDTDIECDQWWQTKQEEELQNTLNNGDSIDTENWQTYRNEKYGFEFNYPEDWGHSVESNYTTQFTDAEGLLTFTIIMPIKDINWGDDLSLLKEEKINTNNVLLIKKTFKIVSSKEDFFVLAQWARENNSGEFVYWYSDPKGYYDSEETLSKILSTFKFIK